MPASALKTRKKLRLDGKEGASRRKRSVVVIEVLPLLMKSLEEKIDVEE
jgi:hypothetical protein